MLTAPENNYGPEISKIIRNGHEAVKLVTNVTKTNAYKTRQLHLWNSHNFLILAEWDSGPEDTIQKNLLPNWPPSVILKIS